MDAAEMHDLILVCVARLAALWAEPALSERVTVRLSTRLRTAMGICRAASGRIELNMQQLADAPALLQEVLCHELAHLLVYQRYGRRARPHGPEWQELVRAAGYAPSLEMKRGMPTPFRGFDGVTSKFERPRVVLHRCPVCHAHRLARRAVHQWRCAECQAAGLGGQLEISLLQHFQGEMAP